MNPFELIRSGLVRRWHTNPDLAHSGETLGHHQWVVANLVLWFHPSPSMALVKESLRHDVGELKAGDLSQPFKARNPELAAEHSRLELSFRDEICGTEFLTEEEAGWLKLCDRLAAYVWMLGAAPHLRHQAGWRSDMEWIFAEAEKRDRRSAVALLINPFLKRLEMGL